MTVLHMLALPIFPGRLQPSIVGRTELNFRVRDGNGWTLSPINTNFVDTSFASFVSAAAKTHSLRCVSSSNHKRFAGLRFEFYFSCTLKTEQRQVMRKASLPALL